MPSSLGPSRWNVRFWVPAEIEFSIPRGGDGQLSSILRLADHGSGVVNEKHLRRILKEWVRHYNQGRPHSRLGPEVTRTDGQRHSEAPLRT